MKNRALRAALSVPWMIREEELFHILEIASRNNLDITAAVKIAENRNKVRMQSLGGEQLKGTRSVVVTEDGVAIVPVFDSLFRRANLFAAISGAMSMEMIQRDFMIAFESQKVKAIMLDIDSPGGEVNYTEELADTIYQARLSGRMPIKACVTGMATSAAFWIATASDEIVASRTAFLGSVGVIATFIDDSKLNESIGIEEIEIISSVSPDKAPDPATPDGKKKIQAIVDHLGEVFVATVARNLSITAADVKEWKGGIKVGSQAVEAGMARRLSSRSDLIGELTRNSRAAAAPSPATPTAQINGSPYRGTPAIVNALDDVTINGEVDFAARVETYEIEAPGVHRLVSSVYTENFNPDTIIEEEGDTMGDDKNQAPETTAKPKDGLAVSAIRSLAASAGYNLVPADGSSEVAPAAVAPVESEKEKELKAKVVDSFVKANVGAKVVPAAADPLRELYVAAQEHGIEGQVEAFVEALPGANFMQDVIPVTANGNGYATATDASSDEDASIERARANARSYAQSNSGE